MRRVWNLQARQTRTCLRVSLSHNLPEFPNPNPPPTLPFVVFPAPLSKSLQSKPTERERDTLHCFMMLLRTATSVSIPSRADEVGQLSAHAKRRCSETLLRRGWKRSSTAVVAVAAAAGDGQASARSITGLVFEPFEELKHEPALVPTKPDQSLARHNYLDDCEAAVNEQINVEYNASYIYHAMYAYFDRDNVALRGLAKFFKESSEEEREHAEKFMKYQNKRGGRVNLKSILMPLSEYDHYEKGDALYAMELALAVEKLTTEKLLNLQKVSVRCHDVQLQDFVESEYLAEQVESVKKISDYVAQLRRVGKGHGVWHFDEMLLHEGGAA